MKGNEYRYLGVSYVPLTLSHIINQLIFSTKASTTPYIYEDGAKASTKAYIQLEDYYYY